MEDLMSDGEAPVVIAAFLDADEIVVRVPIQIDAIRDAAYDLWDEET
jgi:hypothetical protein